MRRINLDAMDDAQVREAARMLELENERLFREVIEQRKKLAELLGDEERQKLLCISSARSVLTARGVGRTLARMTMSIEKFRDDP